MSYRVVWDEGTGGVLLSDSEAGAIQGEVRPVFFEELDLLGFDAHWTYPHAKEPLLWAVDRRYYYRGQQVAEARGGGFFEKPTIECSHRDLSLEPVDVPAMLAANTQVMDGLVHHAIEFIDRTHRRYRGKVDITTVAFSGGKDSLVVLDLVQRALPPDEFVVVFDDTTMEISATYEAVHRAQERFAHLTFLTARSEKPASQTWRELGPPSRLQRWCCTVHKSAPTLATLRSYLGRPAVRALVVEGVRHQESQRRATYDDVSEGGKHGVQVNARPVIDWTTSSVFLYLLGRNLLLNSGYRHGLARVGCIVCPFGSDWSETIIWQKYGAEAQPLLDLLLTNAREGRSDPESRTFVHEGGWKTRAGGRALPNGGNRVVVSDDADSMTFAIQEPSEDWLTWLKPLGEVSLGGVDRGSVLVQTKSLPFAMLRGEHGLTVRVDNTSGADRFLRSYLRAVANKAAYCTHCGGCVADCPTGALVVNGSVTVGDDCIHCARCLGEIERGCLAAKSLQAGEGGTVVKGLDRYCTFGLRRTWLDQYFDDPDTWWHSGKIGPKQFPAMRAWLKEAEVIDNGARLTALGQKLRSVGTSSPLTWAVIWANLARNSTVVNWFVSSVPWQGQYSKADLVQQLGEGVGQRTRENGVAALLGLLRETPLGQDMGFGAPSEAARGAFLKRGWTDPPPEALLYSLYRYAEKEGRYGFSLGELFQGGSEGPHALYGISRDLLSRELRGIESRRSGWLRLELVRDLDNVYLEPSRHAAEALDLRE